MGNVTDGNEDSDFGYSMKSLILFSGRKTRPYLVYQQQPQFSGLLDGEIDIIIYVYVFL